MPIRAEHENFLDELLEKIDATRNFWFELSLSNDPAPFTELCLGQSHSYAWADYTLREGIVLEKPAETIFTEFSTESYERLVVLENNKLSPELSFSQRNGSIIALTVIRDMVEDHRNNILANS